MVKLELELQEAQLIINALDELPHKISRKLIDNIVEQVNEQLKEQKEIPAE